VMRGLCPHVVWPTLAKPGTVTGPVLPVTRTVTLLAPSLRGIPRDLIVRQVVCVCAGPPALPESLTRLSACVVLAAFRREPTWCIGCCAMR